MGTKKKDMRTCAAAAAEEAIKGLKLPSAQCAEDDEQQLQGPRLVFGHAQLLQCRLHKHIRSGLPNANALTLGHTMGVISGLHQNKLQLYERDNRSLKQQVRRCSSPAGQATTPEAQAHLDQLREDGREDTLQHRRLDHHVAEEPEQLQRQRALLQAPSAQSMPSLQGSLFGNRVAQAYAARHAIGLMKGVS